MIILNQFHQLKNTPSRISVTQVSHAMHTHAASACKPYLQLKIIAEHTCAGVQNAPFARRPLAGSDHRIGLYAKHKEAP